MSDPSDALRPTALTRKARGVLTGLRDHLGFGTLQATDTGVPVLAIREADVEANIVWMARRRALRAYWPVDGGEGHQNHRDLRSYDHVRRFLRRLARGAA